jgi:hypothetical protein
MKIENINEKDNYYAAERAATLPFFPIIVFYMLFIDCYYYVIKVDM